MILNTVKGVVDKLQSYYAISSKCLSRVHQNCNKW